VTGAAAAHAAAVLAAFDDRRMIQLPSDAGAGFDDADGYVVGAHLRAMREARGEVVVGRKIGFTNPALMAQYGIAGPIWGPVYDTTLHRAPAGTAQLAIGHLLQPKIEPEIQLHFTRTPRAGFDEEELLACVDWLSHGFELVQCPYPDWKFTSADAVAAGSLHAALVVGPPVAVAGIADCAAKLRDFTIVLAGDGGEQVAGGGASVLGSPLLAVAELVRSLADQPGAEPIQPGEIVSTGSLTAALAVAPAETWSTTITGIELPGAVLQLTG
jgi:2-keto-4-pentenoate hydratase